MHPRSRPASFVAAFVAFAAFALWSVPSGASPTAAGPATPPIAGARASAVRPQPKESFRRDLPLLGVRGAARAAYWRVMSRAVVPERPERPWAGTYQRPLSSFPREHRAEIAARRARGAAIPQRGPTHR